MQHWRIYGGLEAAYEVDEGFERVGYGVSSLLITW